jgi:hypothetical protein
MRGDFLDFFFFVQRNFNDFVICARCIFKKKTAILTAVKHNTRMYTIVYRNNNIIL